MRPPLFITQDAYQTISEMQSSKGLALADLLGELALLLGGLQLPKNARIYLLSELADLEHRLSQVMDDRLQLVETALSYGAQQHSKHSQHLLEFEEKKHFARKLLESKLCVRRDRYS